MKCLKSAVLTLIIAIFSAGSGVALAQGPIPASCANPLQGDLGEDDTFEYGPLGCAVLQLGSKKVSMSHGSATGVDGDLCMASGSKLQMSGKQRITDTAYLEPGVRKSNLRASAVVDPANLSDEIQKAQAAADDLAKLDCDQTFDKLKISSSSPSWIDANNNGQVVICVNGNMEVKGSKTRLYLSGLDGDSFVFNIGGSFKVNGAKIETIDGLSPADVVFNIIGKNGKGKDVAFSGGGGGAGKCCKAEIDGTILAPHSKIRLSPGKVNGQVISGKDISLSSGSLVACLPEQEEDGE